MAAAVASYREPTPNHIDQTVNEFLKDLPGAAQNDGDRFSMAPDGPPRDIDEEIKVSKKRKAIAKLDAERLLSERGVPELRRRAAKRLKFQGKGHEYTDMSRLLSVYQMWLDDLYPRAKFRDGLSLVEKVGHTKRLQVMRKGWMQATRPSQRIEDEEREEAESVDGTNAEQNPQPTDSTSHIEPDEDELDALMAADTLQERSPARRQDSSRNHDPAEMDDLDALLEQETESRGHEAGTLSQHTHDQRDDQFADEEEVMAEMGHPW